MEPTKEELMAEAKSLGLAPHPATGWKKLQEMINAELSKGEPSKEKSVNKVQTETKVERMSRLRNEQRKMIRVVVHCNNDNKKEWTGQIETVICAAGTLKRFVPFDNENGWHVEQGLLDTMLNRTCQKFKNHKLKNGQESKVSYTVKEFNIEILPPLTEKELKNLAADQSARGSIDV